MTTAIFCLLVTALGMSAAAQSPTPIAASPIAPAPEKVQGVPGMTEIDGSKNPELIPDHVVWRMTFNRLAEIKRRGDEADYAHRLKLGDADYAVLYAEAASQRGRDEACQARYRAREVELREARAPADAEAAALDEVLIDCRSKDLDAGDRVMDALSEAGRLVLTEYLEDQRRSTSALVPQRELKNFRLPR